ICSFPKLTRLLAIYETLSNKSGVQCKGDVRVTLFFFHNAYEAHLPFYCLYTHAWIAARRVRCFKRANCFTHRAFAHQRACVEQRERGKLREGKSRAV